MYSSSPFAIVTLDSRFSGTSRGMHRFRNEIPLLLSTRVSKDFVELLQSFTSGFRNQEIRPDAGQETHHSKEYVCAIRDVVHHTGDGDADNKVAKPDHASRERDTL